MTFKPSPLPQLYRKPIQVLGITGAYILKSKFSGFRTSKHFPGESYPMEKLLLISIWGTGESLDLTPMSLPEIFTGKIEDCKRLEPGTVKYYVCTLSGSEDRRRPLNFTPIACQHLADGKSFDTIEAALEEYGED